MNVWERQKHGPTSNIYSSNKSGRYKGTNKIEEKNKVTISHKSTFIYHISMYLPLNAYFECA